MSVLGTNGVFAVELYMKFLMVVASYNSSTFSGKHDRGHNLDRLYKSLKKSYPIMVSELETKYQSTKYGSGDNLQNFLKGVRDQFEKWRYSYDSGVLNINLNKLSDLLNILEDYSRDKFRKISFDLVDNAPKPQTDSQSMSINNINDIKSNFFI